MDHPANLADELKPYVDQYPIEGHIRVPGDLLLRIWIFLYYTDEAYSSRLYEEQQLANNAS